MKNRFIPIIIVLVVVVTGYYLYSKQSTQKPVTQNEEVSQASNVSSDDALKVVMPLFPNIEWNDPKKIGVGYEITSKTESYATEYPSEKRETVENFRQFYNTRLEAAGYMIDNNTLADGPTGSVWGYRKGNLLIVFSYNSTVTYISDDSPEATCPCTRQFKIEISE